MSVTQIKGTGIPRYLPWQGPALFSQGFRPFFLLAGLSAFGVLALWLAVLLGQIDLPTAFSPVAWHGHEMIFGVIAAVVAGFLLTAVPNWTGRMPLQGWGLIGLVLLWLAGRAASATGVWIGAVPSAGLDMLFLPVLLAVVVREVVAGRNWRNLPVAVALGLLALANGLSHLENLGVIVGDGLGFRLGVTVISCLIALIGGRIIPSFTGNWLMKQDPAARRPATFGAFDRVVLALTIAALGTWTAAPASPAAAVLLLMAGGAQAARFARWRGVATLSEPLVWSLHAGYFWLPVGLLLLGAAYFDPGIPQSGGLHALTAGAMGGMVLAVMTRASLGHTGRPLAAGAATTAVYVLVFAAAAARVGAALAPMLHGTLLTVAAVAWCAAFGLFCLAYGPVLLRPRAA